MASPIRLVATDLDGTLFRPDATISRQSIETLTELRDIGIETIPATGRGPAATHPLLARYDLFDLAICSNGSALVDLETGAVLQRHFIEETVLAAVIADLRRRIPGISFGWECRDGFGWDEAFDDHASNLDEALATALADVRVLPTNGVSKLLAVHPELKRGDLAHKVRGSIDDPVEVSHSGAPFVEITASGVTKAAALAALCLERDIDPSEVIAFGDSHNDLAMLEWAGVGVAIAGSEAADDIGTVTDPGDPHPVSSYLRRHVLGGECSAANAPA